MHLEITTECQIQIKMNLNGTKMVFLWHLCEEPFVFPVVFVYY